MGVPVTFKPRFVLTTKQGVIIVGNKIAFFDKNGNFTLDEGDELAVNIVDDKTVCTCPRGTSTFFRGDGVTKACMRRANRADVKKFGRYVSRLFGGKNVADVAWPKNIGHYAFRDTDGNGRFTVEDEMLVPSQCRSVPQCGVGSWAAGVGCIRKVSEADIATYGAQVTFQFADALLHRLVFISSMKGEMAERKRIIAPFYGARGRKMYLDRVGAEFATNPTGILHYFATTQRESRPDIGYRIDDVYYTHFDVE